VSRWGTVWIQPYKDLISLPFDGNNYIAIFASGKRAVLQRLQIEHSMLRMQNMNMNVSPVKTKSRIKALLGSALALGLGGIVASEVLLTPTAPAYADAVHVMAPQAPSFADVVEAVSPAVVSVRVEARIEQTSGRDNFSFGNDGFDFLPKDHPLRRFFDRRFGDQGQGFNKRRKHPRRFGKSLGSGFFVSDDGYVVTNNHVVDNGTKFTIVMHDGTELDAKLVGTDPKTDLAVLKVDASKKFTYVEFTKKKTRIGEWVVAVGNPFGLGGTVTAGIVSARGRDIRSGPYDDYIQIDAAVNKGNSGGPTFNLNGEVIGINTAIFSPSGGNVGIAFAVPASTAREVVKDLISDGSVTRGWLGVQIQSVTPDIAESLGLEKANGAIVSSPQKGSPADKAGIKSGDVITAVDGRSIKGPKELAKLIAGYAPSEKAAISVWRNGGTRDIEVKLGKLPGAKKASGKSAPAKKQSELVPLESFGLTLSSTENGVTIADVEPDSPAAKKGFRKGNVILSVNGTEVATVADVEGALAQAVAAKRKAVLFQIRSGNNNRFVALPVAKG